MDNATSHQTSDAPENIELHFLPPNVTSKHQLLDRGVFHSLKCHYRFLLSKIPLRYIQESKTRRDFSVRQPIELTKQTWIAISPSTINNCVKHVSWSCETAETTLLTAADFDLINLDKI
jgi:hypothetical protein